MVKINANTINGIFESGYTDMTSLSENEILIAVSACREPLFVALDLTSVSSDGILTVFDKDGKAWKEIAIDANKFNLIPMTTEGLKDIEGNIKLSLNEYSGVKIAVFGYTPVVNH